MIVLLCFIIFRFSLSNMSSLWSSASSGNGSNGFFSQIMYAEKAFNSEAAQQWSESAKSISLWLSASYVVLIFTGQQLMRSRSPFKLQTSLFLWNLVLSLFSIVGAFRTVPELYSGLVDYGWTYTVCDPSFHTGSTGLWSFAFTVSKAYELGDTLFVVLRRQPLIFLHWYHHITVMIYCFYSYPAHVGSARWYIVMNYFIHSIMYTYYALRAAHFRMPSLVRMSVTSLQIVQMVIGLVVTISVLVIKHNGGDCHQTYSNAAAAVLMYGSYFVLFIHFFYQQYARPPRKKSPDDKKSDFSVEEVKKLH